MPCGDLYMMLMDTRYIFRGGFIPCFVYKSVASILLYVSAVGISLAIFFIHVYNHVKKQMGRDCIQQDKERMYCNVLYTNCTA